ncbi:MAG TPA: WecB/TagA/CpsF family glycosyltransferase, partial [Chitinophagaceae bacterium]
MKKVSLLNFTLTTGKYSAFLDEIIGLAQSKKSAVVCVANVHMYSEAHKDKKFENIISEAEIVTPDGKPLTWALRVLYGIRQERVAGMDVLPDLLKQMSSNGISAFFYGSSEVTLEKTNEYLSTVYPELKIAGLHSPPFYSSGDLNNNNADEEVITAINGSLPSVVFVVLGCPKQEKWMAAMRGRINTVMVGIGGALPVMIGMQKRAPKWMQNAGLEWLYRLMQEPGRLFKRYATTNRLFIWVVFKEYFRLKLLVP